MQPKEPLGRSTESSRPLLMVDIDGVISLFGLRLDASGRPGEVDGSFHSIDGIPHFLSSTAAAHLLSLAPLYELVWASGWEERADEHLPHLLGLPEGLPFLRFPRVSSASSAVEGDAGTGARTTLAHWKLQSVAAYAGDRPLAWIDDAFDDSCHGWAAARTAATLLVPTDPQQGLTSREARRLEEWAREPAAG
jgi:hypothetical protein